MLSFGSEPVDLSMGNTGRLTHSLLLGPSSHGPLLTSCVGGAVSASSATAQRLAAYGFIGAPVLPFALSSGNGTNVLAPLSQLQQKQFQQYDTGQRRHSALPVATRPNPNIPIILSALRHHVRALVRIMYSKQSMKLSAREPLEHEAGHTQRSSCPVLYESDPGIEYGDCRNLSELHNASRSYIESLVSNADEKIGAASETPVRRSGDSSTNSDCRPSKMVVLAARSHDVGAVAPRSPPTAPLLQHSERSGSQEESFEVVDGSTLSRRGTPISDDSETIATASPPLLLGTGDGATEGWEGQCLFHEEHLDACSLNEFSEYLQIFSCFLGLPLPEVSKQDPSTLQHVRLQLLLLRNNHQQQPGGHHNFKPLLQRWLPLLQVSSLGSGAENGVSGGPFASYTAGAIASVAPCWRFTGSGPSPTMAFGSISTPLISPISPSPGTHLLADLPPLAAPASTREQTTSNRTEATGECENSAAGPLAQGESRFPSSSVDAFSVDGPSSGSNLPRSGKNSDTGVISTFPTDFVSYTVPTSLGPAAACDASTAAASVLSRPTEREKTLSWSPECTVAAAGALATATALRLPPIGVNRVGLGVPGLTGDGKSIGLGGTFSLPEVVATNLAHQGTEGPTEASANTPGCSGVGTFSSGESAALLPASAPCEWMRDGAAPTLSSMPPGAAFSSYLFLNNRQPPGDHPAPSFVEAAGSVRGSSTGGPTSPADSRAFSVALLGFEGAKKKAQQYATHCRRQCSSKRASCRTGKEKEETRDDGCTGGPRVVKEIGRRSACGVPVVPQVTLGLTGPPGGAFNLAKSSSEEFILPKSDFSASRVARLSRRAMELPYVHGVRFEAANFAWVAQMRGEARRFLVKKHGFVKSRLCAIEKIEMWRAALPPEALASELKAEQDVLAMVPAACLEEADLKEIYAVEESMRLKFQRRILTPKSSVQGNPPAATKRQRTSDLNDNKEAAKASASHDFDVEHFLPQPDHHVTDAQQINVQRDALYEEQRYPFQHSQQQSLQSSQQQHMEHHQQQPLQHHQLLRSTAALAPVKDHTAGRNTSLQQPHQMMLPLQAFRTRGHQQQLLLQQFSSFPLLPGLRLQRQPIGNNVELSRALSG
ncbi:hypothetical protein cyc_08449 [Cyclospora cayetanensis]|uniref:Uncharacterized protein n=1 Tax=Cyclospora cayetanensis TaxID=88456 RepID=A0A1D3D614_9EIME|nr:hypothetical protein cyc_08449 [Cyclospora cayetanensis]